MKPLFDEIEILFEFVGIVIHEARLIQQ